MTDYVLSKTIETPNEWLARSASGRATGRNVEAQRCAAMLLCIERGHRTARAIAAALKQDWPGLDASQTVVLQRLKSMALTGLLVPCIETLPKDRYRFHFVQALDDIPDGLETLESANACADDPDELPVPWLR